MRKIDQAKISKGVSLISPTIHGYKSFESFMNSNRENLDQEEDDLPQNFRNLKQCRTSALCPTIPIYQFITGRDRKIQAKSNLFHCCLR